MAFAAPNATTIITVFQYASYVTFGWFWNLMLLASFVVALGVMIGRNRFPQALAAAAFFNTIISLIFFVADFITQEVVYIHIVLSILSIWLLWKE